ncbi:MAG: hypothetical protein ACE14P_12795 [Methanotrichaceae archaeon]
MASGIFLIKEDSGVNIPDDAITKRPNILISVFEDKSSLDQLLETLDWVIKEIKAS